MTTEESRKKVEVKRKQVFTLDELQTVSRTLAKDFGIKVRMGGSQCEVHGKTIWIPSIPDGPADKDLIKMLRAFIDEETAHLVGKSDMSLQAAIAGKLGATADKLLQKLEDIRCHALMGRKWIGCGFNLHAGAEAVDRYFFEEQGLSTAELDEFDQLTWGISRVGSEGLEPDSLPEGMAGWVSEFLAKYKDEIRACQDAESHAALVPLVERMVADLKQDDPPPQQQPDKQGDEGEAGEGEPEEESQDGGSGDGPDGGGSEGGEGEPDKDQEGQGEGKGGDSGDEDSKGDEADVEQQGQGQSGEDSEGSSQGDDPEEGEGDGKDTGDSGGSGASDSAPAAPPNIDALAGKCGGDMLQSALNDKADENRHDEDGVATDAPLPCFCPEIDGFRPWNTKAHHDQAAKFWRVSQSVGGAARQKLSQILQSEAKKWWRGDKDRGWPDPRNLAALATGTSNRVMRTRKNKAAPNTACTLLIDGSGSMSYGLSGTACLAAAAFCELIELSGHKARVATFQTFASSRQDSSAREASNASWSELSEHRQRTHAKVERELRAKHSKKELMAMAREKLGRRSRSYTEDQWIDRYIRVGRQDEVSRFPVVLHDIKPWAIPIRLRRAEMTAAKSLCHGSTPLGIAIHIACQDLATRSEKRKVLLAFTDGVPSDRDLVKWSCEFWERRGIEIALIGIKSSSVESLHHRHAVAWELDDLGKTTMDQLRKALGK